MICAFSEPARTVGRATVNPQYCRCLKLRLEKKKIDASPCPGKGIFPLARKLIVVRNLKVARKIVGFEISSTREKKSLPEKIYVAKIVDLRLREIFSLNNKKLSV